MQPKQHLAFSAETIPQHVPAYCERPSISRMLFNDLCGSQLASIGELMQQAFKQNSNAVPASSQRSIQHQVQ